jgi:Ferritin-like
MLQYLYASYSLKDQTIAGMVRLIAIEEMGHFITVQNLLAACGGALHFGRSEWGQKGFFQPFAFKLEPASIGSLAKYAVAEMPDTALVPPDIKPDLSAIIAQGDTAAGSPVETHRIGLLYAKIYWLTRQSDAPLADPAQEPWSGFPVAEMAATPGLAGRHVHDGFVSDARSVNASPEQWRGNFDSVIVKPISGRDDALRAIADIVAQGEGFANSPQGHFERFVGVWRLAKSQADLALPMPVNPFYATDGGVNPAGDEITSTNGRQFALLGDRLYELVLLCIAANLLLPSVVAPDIRIKPAQAAIAAMRSCLHDVASALLSIPLSDQNQVAVCGLPFTIPSQEIASNLKAVRDRARAVIAELHGIIGEIDQGTATLVQQAAADGIGDVLDDPILKAINALPF